MKELEDGYKRDVFSSSFSFFSIFLPLKFVLLSCYWHTKLTAGTVSCCVNKTIRTNGTTWHYFKPFSVERGREWKIKIGIEWEKKKLRGWERGWVPESYRHRVTISITFHISFSFPISFLSFPPSLSLLFFSPSSLLSFFLSNHTDLFAERQSFSTCDHLFVKEKNLYRFPKEEEDWCECEKVNGWMMENWIGERWIRFGMRWKFRKEFLLLFFSLSLC